MTIGRENWYASLVAAAAADDDGVCDGDNDDDDDDETDSAASVFEQLARVSVAARAFGPNSPFSFPHAPVALERVLVYRKDGNSVVFTAETGAGFLCFRFFTS